MTSYLTAIAIIFLLFLGWVVVQHLARTFARRHPEFGPAREEGGGCGKSCSCSRAGQCERKSGRDAR
ncbi:MAG: hypothetical protein PHQ14_12550 [Chromatiales bacterium]|nr:hypothetical protein [Chromatiales bacterium]